MLTEGPVTGAACAVDGGRVNWRRCLPRTLAGGLVVGFLTGLLAQPRSVHFDGAGSR